MKMKTFLSRGFTLVELMIVIAIIGILAAVLYPGLMGYFEGARDTSRVSAFKNYALALSNYNVAKQTYPVSAGPVTQDSMCAKSLFQYLSGSYMKSMNKDPKATQSVTTPANTMGATSNSCAGEPGGYVYITLQSADKAQDFGSSYLMAARMEKRENANYDGKNGLEHEYAAQVVTFEKGDTKAKAMETDNVPANRWYYLYSQ